MYLFLSFIGAVLIVTLVGMYFIYNQPICPKCGKTETSLYLHENIDASLVGYFCKDCDKKFIEDFYAGKYDK